MHLKIGRNPKGEACLPTIHFQGRAVSFREGISQIWQQETRMIISVRSVSLIILSLGVAPEK